MTYSRSVKTKDLNFLDHIRIGVKLIIGFITITLLVVFMAFFGIKNFNDLNTQLEITDMVMDSLVALEAARTNQVKYEIEPDSETASEVYANLSDAKLTALKAQKLMKSEVNKSNVDQLLAAINTFQLNFNRFEDLEDTKADDKATTEEATLNFITAIEQALSREGDYIASLTTADQIESSFNKYVHMTELKDEFFGIYVLTTQYSSTPTDDIENQIDNSISQMRADYETLIATLNDQDTKEYLAIANQQLDTFEEAFNSYESSVGQQEDLRAMLNESASEASDIADEIDAGVQAYIVDLQASVLGFSNIITLLAIAISIILTFFITRSITKPINNAINIITDIASYDLTKPVPATLINRRDEFGKLGQAMETNHRQFPKGDCFFHTSFC